jgi:hypothetical protein
LSGFTVQDVEAKWEEEKGREYLEMVYTITNIVLLTVDNAAWHGIKKGKQSQRKREARE